VLAKPHNDLFYWLWHNCTAENAYGGARQTNLGDDRHRQSSQAKQYTWPGQEWQIGGLTKRV